MVRLLGGIGIYLAVLLGVFIAAPSRAAEPTPEDRAIAAHGRDVRQSAAQAFDLESIHPHVKDLPVFQDRKGTGVGPPQVPDLEPEAFRRSAPWRFRGPALNYQAGTGGPLIELGMFGGTVEPGQRLAHLALDWDF